jgi:hypothetical protein
LVSKRNLDHSILVLIAYSIVRLGSHKCTHAKEHKETQRGVVHVGAGCDKHREHSERVGGQDTGRLTRSKFIIRVPRMCCVMCTAALLEQFKEQLVEVCWRHQTRGDGELCHFAIRQ